MAKATADADEPDIELIVDTEEAPDEEEEEKEKVIPIEEEVLRITGQLLSRLEERGPEFLNAGLPSYSPKFATVLGNLRTSPGPVLVYSNFKRLEGLGIFAAVLRAADEQFLPLDVQQGADGMWRIPDALMDVSVRNRPRYIVYSGDQSSEQRKLLLQLYNADIDNLPPILKAQCTELLAGAPDNRDGRICKVFMITQSGAEGISLFNTRQVHIMEPYWNNVRLQQVIGRAIRLCSHMNLPWEERVVDVFTYVSVFTTAQKSGDSAKMLMALDKRMTTDQMILNIATTKQRLADGLAAISQDAAADCELHYHEHGKVTHCFNFGTNTPMFMFHPDWKKDIQASGKFRAV